MAFNKSERPDSPMRRRMAVVEEKKFAYFVLVKTT